MTLNAFINADYHGDIKISPDKFPTEITLTYPTGPPPKGFETTFRKHFPQSSNSKVHHMEYNPVVGVPTHERSNTRFKPNDNDASIEEVFLYVMFVDS